MVRWGPFQGDQQASGRATGTGTAEIRSLWPLFAAAVVLVGLVLNGKPIFNERLPAQPTNLDEANLDWVDRLPNLVYFEPPP